MFVVYSIYILLQLTEKFLNKLERAPNRRQHRRQVGVLRPDIDIAALCMGLYVCIYSPTHIYIYLNAI